MDLVTAAEVPGFLILRNLVPAGKDANGHPIFKADRTKVTIQEVIVAAIRKQWIDYFSITTGHRASMTANPR